MGLRRILVAATVVVAVASGSTIALAANGDCSQPASNSAGPATSDCLYILKVAVGTLSCSPTCICAPKGTLPTTTADALLCLRKSVGQSVTLNCPCSTALSSDNFNDNTKDPQKWDVDDLVSGNGVLTETNQVLQYTVASSTDLDYVVRPWIGSVLPYNANWEVRMDLSNTTVPVNDDEVTSMGVSVYKQGNTGDEVYGELYASHLGGPPARNGFFGELYHDGDYVTSVDSTAIDGLTTGAVRIAFNATTKVFTLYYDVDPSNGYTWVSYGSLSVDGTDGVDGNADWGMTNSDRFTLAVYGYGEQIPVSAGQVRGDNFTITGAIAP